VISSDFPRWRAIIEQAGCGLLVNPEDTQEIAGAIIRILNNPVEAEAMGKRGRRAIVEMYNWEQESATLLQLVEDLGERRRQ
jgi:glycosyltransferase involved in cell wall biosynthesis